MRLDLLQQMPERGEDMGLGALSTSRGNLPLIAVSIRASINGFLSKTTLTQTFYNGHQEALEATYLFPIPPRAAVQRFIMRLPEREIMGVVKEREAAQQEYQAAIEKGHQAAIAEEERPGLFTLRVGNIPPRTEVEVELIVVGPLQLNEDEATFAFPLVVAPRYIPGAPLEGPSVGDGVAPDTDAVPDASRISAPVLLPGFPSAVRFSFEASINPAGLTLRALCSSLHQMNLSESDGRYMLAVNPGERLDRDIIIRFRFAAESLQSHLLLSSNGSFFLTLVPPQTKAAPAPRDVVFLLDRSGSMRGWKFTAAKRAMARMLDTLRDADRFAVCLFDTSVEGPSAIEAGTDRRRFQAIEALSRAEVAGGTEMSPAFRRAGELLLSSGERERFIVFVTDGQVGNEDQLLQQIDATLKGVRIFSLGIDQAVNEGFLRRVSTATNGLYELVESEERLDEVMDRLHRALMPASLTSLSLHDKTLTLEEESVRPTRLPDVFASAPAQIFGRYTSPGELELKGTLPNQEPFSAAVEGIQIADGESIDTLWARSALRELEERFIIGDGKRDALEKKMIEISTRFGVVCRFTALLAIDYDTVVNKSGKQQKMMQPAEQPAGWDGKKQESGVMFSLSELMSVETDRVKAEREEPMRRGWVSLPSQPNFTRTDPSTVTRSGAIIGTPNYMSPEQVSGLPSDERSHIYVLGVLLYEALTGKNPNAADSFMQTMMNVIQQPTPKISMHDAALTMFDALLEKCLEKKATDRYKSFTALAEALEALHKSSTETAKQWMSRFANEEQAQEAALQSFSATRSFGPYEIGPQQGGGIRGQYFLGAMLQADGTRRPVLIEELDIYQDSHAQNKFMNEIRFVHPSVIELIEAIEAGDHALFLAFAYEPGLSLEQLLRGGKLPASVAIEIFSKAARVFAEASTQGLSPESINDETIFVTFDGEVKLRRWGAALSSKWIAPRVKHEAAKALSVATSQPMSMPRPIMAASQPTPEPRPTSAPQIPSAPERKQWWKFWK